MDMAGPSYTKAAKAMALAMASFAQTATTAATPTPTVSSTTSPTIQPTPATVPAPSNSTVIPPTPAPAPAPVRRASGGRPFHIVQADGKTAYYCNHCKSYTPDFVPSHIDGRIRTCRQCARLYRRKHKVVATPTFADKKRLAATQPKDGGGGGGDNSDDATLLTIKIQCGPALKRAHEQANLQCNVGDANDDDGDKPSPATSRKTLMVRLQLDVSANAVPAVLAPNLANVSRHCDDVDRHEETIVDSGTRQFLPAPPLPPRMPNPGGLVLYEDDDTGDDYSADL